MQDKEKHTDPLDRLSLDLPTEEHASSPSSEDSQAPSPKAPRPRRKRRILRFLLVSGFTCCLLGCGVAGNAIGGMMGRVISSFLAEHWGWRVSSVSIGLLCALFALLFLAFSPRSLNFKPHRESFHSLIVSNLALITSRKLIPFYLCGSLMLGIFVSLYNYLGFYLVAPPFGFSPGVIHYIYLMYIFGVFGSIATAKLDTLFNHFSVLKAVVLLSLVALVLLFVPTFWVVTLGLAIFTFDFFVVHVTCNRVVSDYSLAHRSVAISMYLLCYYLGSSLWGWATGIVLDHFGWQWFLGALMLLTVVLYAVARHGCRVMQQD